MRPPAATTTRKRGKIAGRGASSHSVREKGRPPTVKSPGVSQKADASHGSKSLAGSLFSGISGESGVSGVAKEAASAPADALWCISPLDGRYGEAAGPLRRVFSEGALICARVLVELAWVSALDAAQLFPRERGLKKRLENVLRLAPSEGTRRVKALEQTLNHDVKAVEYWLREVLALDNPNLIHFGLTSEDVNNLAYSVLFQQFHREFYLPRLRSLILALCELAAAWRASPFPTRTHGQPASPSTAGKEVAVFVSRLTRLYGLLRVHAFRGKLNGAVGNFSAMTAAFPDHDWVSTSRLLVSSLGFEYNPVTTQIEDHDSWAAYFNLVRQVNNVVLDLDQDLWLYLSLGLMRERPKSGEVGSSTMPHKVNPIRFENSEGTLSVANSLLIMFSEKLCRSRLQRDLSDSTVTRHVGSALTQSWLAMGQTLSGLERIELDAGRCQAELVASPFLLAEPIQTILRTVLPGDPYELLRNLTRGRAPTREDLDAFIDGLPVQALVKKRLRGLKPEQYLGLAIDLCDEAVKEARREVDRP